MEQSEDSCSMNMKERKKDTAQLGWEASVHHITCDIYPLLRAVNERLQSI